MTLSVLTQQLQTHYRALASLCLESFTLTEKDDSIIVGLALKTIAENSSLIVPTKKAVLRSQIIRFSQIVENPKSYLTPEHYAAYKKIFLEQIVNKITQIEEKQGKLSSYSPENFGMKNEKMIMEEMMAKLQKLNTEKAIGDQILRNCSALQQRVVDRYRNHRLGSN